MFVFEKTEQRQLEGLDRTQAMIDEQRAREMQGKIDKRAAFSTGMAGISSGMADIVGITGIKTPS